jgi:hypothetical protein
MTVKIADALITLRRPALSNVVITNKRFIHSPAGGKAVTLI